MRRFMDAPPPISPRPGGRAGLSQPKVKSLGWVCIAILGAALLGASAPAAWAGSISGVVTDGSTAAPIPGIQVTAWRGASPGEWQGVAEFTDASGHYTIPGLPKGDYEIEFQPYELNYVAEYYDDERAEEDATLVHLAEGKALAGINASLAVGGEITGQVLGAVGDIPLEGVLACASSQADSSGGCARTDATGAYTIMALTTGSYVVGFDPPWSLNYFGQWYDGTELRKQAKSVPVKEGSATPGIDGALDEAAGIAGRVVDAGTGQPLGEIQVCAIEAGGEEFSRCSYTSGDGHYLVGGMPSGEYKVAFSPERNRDDEKSWEVEDGYFAQYYDNSPSRAAAVALPLTVPSLTTGIDAELMSKSAPIGGFPESAPDPLPSAGREPDTFILPLGTKVVGRSATFRFATKAPGFRFECRMDRRPFARCGSPRTYRHLRLGRHVFEVRAIAWQGDADPTPARYKFKVKLRPRRR